MLHAVRDDFERVPGVETCGIGFQSYPGEEEKQFRALAKQAEYSLIIAPEFDGILLQRCRWVLEEGGRLLGPSPQAVAITSDKYALYQWWKQRGVPTPVTWQAEDATTTAAALARSSVIFKKRDGAGGVGTRILTDVDGQQKLSLLPDESNLAIVQEFHQGVPASVAFLVGPDQCIALPPATQNIQFGEEVHYLGGRVPLPPEQALRAEQIARQAITGLDGLLGYVGVDVILGDDGHDWAIEINPRLTTSYVGLRALAEFNLAEAMLNVVQGMQPELRWRDEVVEFRTDGAIRLSRAHSAAE
jgi:predicted ATP-grasp superfamily ATP-dependent carboligase